MFTKVNLQPVGTRLVVLLTIKESFISVNFVGGKTVHLYYWTMMI